VAPFSNEVHYIDSSVFIYTAKQMIAGQLVYKEVFDHKGLMLYFLNIIGLKIFNGNLVGIWVLQFFCYLLTTTFLYKTLRFFYNKKISILSITTVLLYQSVIDFGGNITETWALPFTSIALYIFTQYFVKQKQFSVVQLFLLSSTFILTLFLRPNLVSLWGAFGIVVIFDLIQSKRWTDILFYTFYILIFCLLTIMPFFLYVYLKGIVKDSIFSMFTFNFIYSSKTGMGSGIIKAFISSLIMMGYPISTFIYLGIIVLTYILCSILYFKEILYKKFVIAVIASIFVIAFSCSIGYSFLHYYVQFVPVLIFPVATFFSFFVKNLPKKKWTFAVFFCIIINLYCTYKIIQDIHRNYSKDNKALYNEINKVVSQYTTSADKILVMGNDENVYLFTNRVSSSKYTYIFPIIGIDKNIEVSYLTEFDKFPLPKLIITDDHFTILSDDIRNKLTMILREHYEMLDINLEKNYSIWKLKEQE